MRNDKLFNIVIWTLSFFIVFSGVTAGVGIFYIADMMDAYHKHEQEWRTMPLTINNMILVYFGEIILFIWVILGGSILDSMLESEKKRLQLDLKRAELLELIEQERALGIKPDLSNTKVTQYGDEKFLENGNDIQHL